MDILIHGSLTAFGAHDLPKSDDTYILSLSFSAV